ncbi:Gp23-like protein [Desulfocucumis palustris]|uniref:Gp23-like protein n=1 Tax=Desulfocucumis palustris TaxID=1898651 RepID=A0A2L2XIH7_9FIRM|nr:ImmA/IrrE family metallo-endopeptidase [Desulfocucumis palustris]GBF35503.1 Gp23-like protein [Desulfocucumis palustris]
MDQKIQSLWEIAEKEGIEVRYTNLHKKDPKLNGLYVWAYNLPIILLDNSLQWNWPQFRCVFAEEVGHYYTSAKSNLLIAQPSYQDKMNLSRDEYRAMCWATDYLIPDIDLNSAINSGKISSPSELSDYFEVTEAFLNHKLEIFKKRKESGGGIFKINLPAPLDRPV